MCFRVLLLVTVAGAAYAAAPSLLRRETVNQSLIPSRSQGSSPEIVPPVERQASTQTSSLPTTGGIEISNPSVPSLGKDAQSSQPAAEGAAPVKSDVTGASQPTSFQSEQLTKTGVATSAHVDARRENAEAALKAALTPVCEAFCARATIPWTQKCSFHLCGNCNPCSAVNLAIHRAKLEKASLLAAARKRDEAQYFTVDDTYMRDQREEDENLREAREEREFARSVVYYSPNVSTSRETGVRDTVENIWKLHTPIQDYGKAAAKLEALWEDYAKEHEMKHGNGEKDGDGNRKMDKTDRSSMTHTSDNHTSDDNDVLESEADEDAEAAEV